MGNPSPACITPIWEVYSRLAKPHLLAYQQLGISYLHAQLLSNRGIKTPEAMRSFIEARYESLLDPLGLTDMERALERIAHALATKEHITIFGDFDADGVTSAALLFRALRLLGHKALTWFIPHRTQEERGLSRSALEQLRSRGTSLIITTDCGSSDVEAVTYARELGIDVIVTDHHSPPDVLPQAYAIINPWLPTSIYPEKVLCGVGVAYKLAQALFRAASREMEEQCMLDLVAVGTIADVAQLLGENHTLVREGLKRLNATSNPGLQALIEVSGLHSGNIRERDVAFGLAPRLNAAGRMQHADLAFQLLITEDPAKAMELAWELEKLNRMRKEQTNQLMGLASEQARSQVDAPIVLIEGPQEMYHEGIIGLVAGKLAETMKAPVIILSRGESASRGSARSYGKLNLIEALQARPDLFLKKGGHAEAAGFTIVNTKIEELHRYLLKMADESGKGADNRSVAQMVDLVITRPEALEYAAYTSIDQLSPFGAGNPEPVFRMDNLRLTQSWTSGADGTTLQVRLQSGNTQVRGSFKGGGFDKTTFGQETLVSIIFNLVPALKNPGSENGQDIWLQILSMNTMPGGV